VSGGQAPLPYQPTGQAGADQSYQALTAAQANPATSLLGYIPTLTGYAQNIGANPYNSQALSGAQGASQYGTGTLTPQLQGAATSLNSLGQQASPYASQILQTAFDPQQALYNQQYQQMLQQQNAINAQNGVASTPYGSGLTGQAAQNFNLNWQNNLLNREATGAGAYNTLTGAIDNAYTGGANLGDQAISTQTSAAGLPSQVYNSQQLAGLSALMQALSGSEGAFGPTQNLVGQQGNYLGIGQNATALSDQATQINNQLEEAGFGGLMNLLGIGSGINQTGGLLGLWGL